MDLTTHPAPAQQVPSAAVDRRRGPPATDPRAGVLAATRSGLARRPQLAFAAALVGCQVLGVVDWLTGADLAFSVFYLLPIAVVAATSTARRAAVVSVVAALTWLVADITAGASYDHPGIPAWNTFSRLTVFLLVGGLIAQLRTSVEHEQELSRTDPLTGVSNSRWFYERAASHLAAADSQVVTLVYLDLDDFKAINDTHGHSGGDDALAAVGAALREASRAGHDEVGRLGGDEFALLLLVPDGDAELTVRRVVQRVVDLLASHRIPIRFSAGAVSFAAAPPSVDAALERADRLMYEVKRDGKRAFRYGGTITSW